jgi:hypothetical protein
MGAFSGNGCDPPARFFEVFPSVRLGVRTLRGSCSHRIQRLFSAGEGPIAASVAEGYLATMNLLVVALVLLLLFVGCFYFAGFVIGGEAIGLILLMGVIIYWVGGSHAKA